MTGGGVGDAGGGTAATGAGAAGVADGDGARGADGDGARGADGGGARGPDGGGLSLDLRMTRGGAGDAPRLGTVRNTSRRRTAEPEETCTGAAWIIAGATTGGCTARAGLAAGGGVNRAAIPIGASGLGCRALMMPNARTASSAIVTPTAPVWA